MIVDLVPAESVDQVIFWPLPTETASSLSKKKDMAPVQGAVYSLYSLLWQRRIIGLFKGIAEAGKVSAPS